MPLKSQTFSQSLCSSKFFHSLISVNTATFSSYPSTCSFKPSSACHIGESFHFENFYSAEMKDRVSVEPLCWVHQLQSKQAGPHVDMIQPTVSHRWDGWSYQGGSQAPLYTPPAGCREGWLLSSVPPPPPPPPPVQTALTALNGDWLLLAGPNWWLHKANRSEGVMRTLSSPLLLESLVYLWRWVYIIVFVV